MLFWTDTDEGFVASVVDGDGVVDRRLAVCDEVVGVGVAVGLGADLVTLDRHLADELLGETLKNSTFL